MKTLQLLFLIIFIIGCSSSKKVLNTTPKTHSQTVEKPIDSFINKSNTFKNTENTSESLKPQIAVKDTTIYKHIPDSLNHVLWDKLLKKHVSNSGSVNYEGFMGDRKALLNYISILGKNLPNSGWTKNKKLAYWINAYNAMTIDLILRHYPVKSIKDIKKPWEQRYWKLGKKWYNLNEIEHDILRTMDEPRIHFAIVCASYSCPKLQNKAFRNEGLDLQLTNVTQEFLNDTSKNYISENNLELSKIFQWFAKDFKKDGSLIDFLSQYSSVNISTNAKKHFKDYDWSLNN